MGRGTAALPILDSLREISGRVPDDVVGPLGEALILMGDYELVAKLFKTAPGASAQRKAHMLVVRGKAFMGLRQMARAKSSFRSARRLDPESVGALTRLPQLGTRFG